MNISVDSLRANSILMENVNEMMLAQEGFDKLHYDSVVLESVANPEGQAVLLDKLYKETEKIENIDFGRIPDTRGDVTKYQYYGQLNDCIELINQITTGASTPNIDAMNKLHRILLDARSDFEFGFKSDNYIIINMYKVMVLTLFELENVCIVDMTNHIRTKLSININSKTASQVRSITKTANQFIKMYENGQWTTLIKSFKSGKAMEFASAYEEGMEPANEKIEGSFAISAGEDLFKAVKELPGTIAKAGKSAWEFSKPFVTGKGLVKPTGKAARIVVIIILALLIIRGAIHLFMNGAANLKKILKNNAEILKVNIANGGPDDSIERQKNLLDHLENTADVIEYNLLKAEKAANTEIAKSNRENFSPADFKNANGADFQF